MTTDPYFRTQAEMLAERPPPASTTGPVGWLRANLFSSWFNAALTLLALYLLWIIVPSLIDWAFIHADFEGSVGNECAAEGACWAWLDQRIDQFLYGFYTDGEYWRVNLAVILLIPALAPLLFDGVPYARQLRVFSVAYPFIAGFLLVGGFALDAVPTRSFGGFMLNLTIGLSGIVLSLPIGIMLALGRRSRLPALRMLSVIFIELVRGVPLITLLFTAAILLPIFMPESWSIDLLIRVIVVVTAFSSAYMAEVIRGGLQAIPKGQFEAAQAMGLGYWQSMRLIILPQVLKISIPGIVNTFIGLFKDTTLVFLIGLFDILGIARSLQQNQDWIGKVDAEGFLFAAIFFFVVCFSMSRYSINLEKRLDTTKR
jgi:general L-amino acid transport system permease protein